MSAIYVMSFMTRNASVVEKELIVMFTVSNLVCFWCLFVLMHDFHTITMWHSFWALGVGVRGWEL